MNDPNRPAAPDIADSNKPRTSEESPNARFRYLLVDDRLDIPNMCYLDCYEKRRDVRDVYTYLVFEDDGTLIFRIVDDVCRYGDNFGSKPFYDITLYIIASARRDEVFNAFLDPVPEDETERRAALAAVLGAALKKSSIQSLLSSKGIAYESAYRAIYDCR